MNISYKERKKRKDKDCREELMKEMEIQRNINGDKDTQKQIQRYNAQRNTCRDKIQRYRDRNAEIETHTQIEIQRYRYRVRDIDTEIKIQR